jgi:hypothetical protein
MYASSFDREYLTDSPYYPDPILVRGGGPIYVSTDGGAGFVKTADLPDPVLSFALDPFQAGTVYAGSLGAFYRSTDYGASWETLFMGDPLGPPEGWFWFFSIVADPVRPNRLYASTSYGVSRSSDGGRTWVPFSRGLPNPTGDARALVISPDGQRLSVAMAQGVFNLDLEARAPCVASDTSLCLVGGRYQVELSAHRPYGPSNPGVARSLGDRAGYFSLPFATGDPDLPEVAVKMLADGAFGASGAPLFYSSLTTLPFVLTVTDMLTGDIEIYASNPTSPFCGGTNIFSDTMDSAAAEPRRAPADASESLLLLGGRFAVTFEAKHPRTGQMTGGTIVQAGDRFSVFSLPAVTGDPQFPEVAVKMVDGRPINGSFWFFQSSLTSLDYVLTVTDTVTGAVRTYASTTPLCGSADTAAFTDSSQGVISVNTSH